MKRNLVLLVFVGVALLVGVNAHAWDTKMHVQIASVVEDYAICPSGSYDFHQYLLENCAAHPDYASHLTDYWAYPWYLPYGREYNHHTCVGIGDMAHVWVSDRGTPCLFYDRGCADTNADLWWKEAYYHYYPYETSTPSFYSTYELLGEGSHYAQDVCFPWHTTALSGYQVCHTGAETFAWNNFYSGYRLSNSVWNGAVYTRSNVGPEYNYDKSRLVHDASNYAYAWSFDSGLNCANYTSWDKQDIWQSLAFLAGAVNMAYYRPICQ